MNRVYFAILAALLTGMLIYGFSPAEENKEKTGTGVSTGASATSETSGQVYTREVLIEQITEGCVSGMLGHKMSEQVSREYCACYAAQVTENLAIEDFSRIGLAGPTQQDREVMETAGRDCAQKVIDRSYAG